MSYTHHSAIATCTINNVLNVNDLCSHLYDYLTNHEDEIPEALQDCTTFEEFAEIVQEYVELSNDKLSISYDSEEGNYDSDIFDFISDHYANLMTSKYMKVIYVSYDSRSGLSADCSYYDNNNQYVDIEKLLNSR